MAAVRDGHWPALLAYPLATELSQLCAEELDHRRSLGEFSESSRQGDHHLALNPRAAIQHRAKSLLGEHEQAQRCLGDDRCVARNAVDHRDLTEEVPGLTARDAPSAPCNVHLPLQEHEKLLAGFALSAQDLALRHLQVVGHA